MAAVRMTPHLDESGVEAVALEEAELVALYEAHYENLIGLAAVLLDAREVCEDVVQDAFARYWTLRRRPEASRAPAYLRSMVLNRARSIMRRRQVFQRLPLRGGDAVADAADLAVLGVEQDALVARLRALPRRQMEVLVLRFWLDESSSEIAETLGISLGSVKTHARRGLAALAGDPTQTERGDDDE